jgi:hypothetical protein
MKLEKMAAEVKLLMPRHPSFLALLLTKISSVCSMNTDHWKDLVPEDKKC